MNPDRGQTHMKVLLHIRSLHIGGSERQVVSLAKSMAGLGTEVHVATILSGGPLERDLADVPDVHMHALGGSGLVGMLQYLLRLRSLIKSNRFDATYGFLPIPNLALLTARTTRHSPLIAWGVRSSDLDLSQYSSRVKYTMRLEKWLSRFSDRIITNSQAALDEYRQKDYPYSKLTHIPNAIDVDRFKPDPDAKLSARKELGVPDQAPLIGLFARLHPMKDHLTFLRAAKLLVEKSPDIRFICAGGASSDYSTYERRVRANATELGLDNHILWLGSRTDPEKLMAACSITTLTSDSGEGFPNSVAESMACGIPVVTTDVGDAAAIVGETGKVVPPQAPQALADAWEEMLAQPEGELQFLGQLARTSIIERYSPAQIAARTLQALGGRQGTGT
ncbi:MAG: glycosyltransferase [Chloroflexi bacterium]|nr:glycosyltransferase [Chloroflexota bacterium]